MAASTTASIRLTASVVDSTYIVRNRNQITSSASRVAPERNAPASRLRRRPVCGAASGVTGANPWPPASGTKSRRAGTASSRRCAAAPAIAAADRQSRAAHPAAPATPNVPMSHSSAPATPVTAPSVFHP